MEYEGTSQLPATVSKHQDWAAKFILNLEIGSVTSEITRLLIARVGVNLAKGVTPRLWRE
jgi:hypothetical protein